MDINNSNELIKLIKGGDTDAAGTLYELHRSRGISIARQHVLNADDAEDMFQDAFLKAMEHIDSFDDSREFTPWLDTIIVNTSKSFLAKKKATSFSDLSDEDSEFVDSLENKDEGMLPESAYDKKEIMDIIAGILDELPKEQKIALTLFYYKDFSIKQIAEAQEVSENTVKSRLNYGRNRVSEAVTEYEKKHKIKLHGAAIVSTLLAMFFKRSSYAAVAEAILATIGLSGAVGAAGVAGAAVAGGSVLKIALIAIGVIAIAGGGIFAAVKGLGKSADKEPVSIVAEISDKTETSEESSIGDNLTASTTTSTTEAEPEPEPEPEVSPLPETIAVGDIITYGVYEQDADLENGAEPINWRVLYIDGNKALLITTDILDLGVYSEDVSKSYWAESVARKWAQKLYEEGFTATEKKYIALTEINDPAGPTEDEPNVNIDPGPATEDYVFMISYNEMETLLERELETFNGKTYHSNNYIGLEGGVLTPYAVSLLPEDYASLTIQEGQYEDYLYCVWEEDGVGYVANWWTRSVDYTYLEGSSIGGLPQKHQISLAGNWGLPSMNPSVDEIGGFRPSIWITLGDETTIQQ